MAPITFRVFLKPLKFASINETMNRTFTNMARFILDELIPPLIRDNKFFMWPFFAIFCRKWDVSFEMNFKSHVLNMSDEDFVRFYKEKKSFASLRPTDLNGQCIQEILKFFSGTQGTVLDVGCGRHGYMVEQINRNLRGIKASGIDINPPIGPQYHTGFVEKLPFDDGAYDFVLCTHTLEHILDLKKGVQELLRVARKSIVVVIPKQRYYYYTVDENINFFQNEEDIRRSFHPLVVDIQNLGGDWFTVVQK